MAGIKFIVCVVMVVLVNTMSGSARTTTDLLSRLLAENRQRLEPMDRRGDSNVNGLDEQRTTCWWCGWGTKIKPNTAPKKMPKVLFTREELVALRDEIILKELKDAISSISE